MSDDRAPRWLVRWLFTVLLLFAIAVESGMVWRGRIWENRAELEAQRLDCVVARTAADEATNVAEARIAADGYPEDLEPYLWQPTRMGLNADRICTGGGPTPSSSPLANPPTRSSQADALNH